MGRKARTHSASRIEGLLEEDVLLAKLTELFPRDKFEHPGKGGDIIQIVIEQSREIGRIVYECKKVKHFDRDHVEQAKDARRIRHADFAILVTNALRLEYVDGKEKRVTSFSGDSTYGYPLNSRPF